jgi:hypothetical protein
MRARHRVVTLVLGCTLTVSACSDGHSTSAAGKRYLAIAEPANDKLETAFDALEVGDHDNLSASQSDLRNVMNAERTFDRDLLRLALPSDAEATAHALVKVNESRADLTDLASESTTLPDLRGFDDRLSAANADVESRVRTLRKQLGLPPPDNS